MPRVQIPVSTPGRLIFTYDKVNKKFNTSNFSPALIQGRATLEEVDSFLKEINIPVARWSEEYEDIHEAKGTYGCLLVFTFLLLPLFFFYICWLSAKQKEAKNKLTEAKQEARKNIIERGSLFKERGLMWNVPQGFPEFIELWVQAGGVPTVGVPTVGPQMVIIQQQQPVYTGMPQQPGYPMTQQRGHVNSYPGIQQGNQMVMMPNQQQQQFYA